MFILSGRMKIFASACVLISMIMLCTTWVKVDEYNFNEYQTIVNLVSEGAKSHASVSDSSFDLHSIQEMLNVMRDGKITAREMVPICKGVKAAIDEEGDPNGDDAMTYTFSYIYRLLFWITVISGVLAIVSFYQDRFQGAEETFFVCQIGLVLLCATMAYWLNNEFEFSGKFLSLTLMPCFAVLLALPIKLKCLLPIEDVIDNGKTPQMEKFVQKSQEVAQNITQMVGYEKWKCKNCGNENLADSRFCAECGCERPEKTKCSNCGVVVGDNDVFCRKCGSLIKTEEDKKKSQKVTCKKCGSPIDAESLFCEHCGAKVE